MVKFNGLDIFLSLSLSYFAKDFPILWNILGKLHIESRIIKPDTRGYFVAEFSKLCSRLNF